MQLILKFWKSSLVFAAAFFMLGAERLATFGFHAVPDADPDTLSLCVDKQHCPVGQKAYPHKDDGRYIMLTQQGIISQADIQEAKAGFHPTTNTPIINFTLKPDGARKFCDFTAQKIGERFAIALNGEVITVPSISGAICGGRGFIEGGFTVQEAENLALALNAGTLPTKLRTVE